MVDILANAHRAKGQNFRNQPNHLPLDPEIYVDHYSKKTISCKVTVKKILVTMCHHIKRHHLEQN